MLMAFMCGQQVVCAPKTSPELSRVVSRLRNEYVVCAKGQVQARKDPNKNMPTGEVEVVLSEVS
jgi:aspartyl-tRNA synthetase